MEQMDDLFNLIRCKKKKRGRGGKKRVVEGKGRGRVRAPSSPQQQYI
jgi:hypothetical protein